MLTVQIVGDPRGLLERFERTGAELRAAAAVFRELAGPVRAQQDAMAWIGRTIATGRTTR